MESQKKVKRNRKRNRATAGATRDAVLMLQGTDGLKGLTPDQILSKLESANRMSDLLKIPNNKRVLDQIVANKVVAALAERAKISKRQARDVYALDDLGDMVSSFLTGANIDAQKSKGPRQIMNTPSSYGTYSGPIEFSKVVQQNNPYAPPINSYTREDLKAILPTLKLADDVSDTGTRSTYYGPGLDYKEYNTFTSIPRKIYDSSEMVDVRYICSVLCPEDYCKLKPMSDTQKVSLFNTNVTVAVTTDTNGAFCAVIPLDGVANPTGLTQQDQPFILVLNSETTTGNGDWSGLVSQTQGPLTASADGVRTDACSVTFLPTQASLNNSGYLQSVVLQNNVTNTSGFVVSAANSITFPRVGEDQMAQLPFYQECTVTQPLRTVYVPTVQDNVLALIPPPIFWGASAYTLDYANTSSKSNSVGRMVMVVGRGLTPSTTVGNIEVQISGAFMPSPGVSAITVVDFPTAADSTFKFLNNIVRGNPSIVTASLHEAQQFCQHLISHATSNDLMDYKCALQCLDAFVKVHIPKSQYAKGTSANTASLISF